MEEYRCPNCNKLFFKGNLVEANIEVKCRNCKTFVNIIMSEGKEQVKESILDDHVGMEEAV